MKKTFKDLVKESGLTYKELSEISGISEQYITKMANGKARKPRVNHIFFTARALKLPIDVVYYAVLESINRNK